MKPSGPLKHFVLAFFIALVVYVVAFYGIEHRRSHNGPWRVAFASAGGAAPPLLIINQPKLNISNVRITFPRVSAARTNSVIIFDHAQNVPFDVPFGQCVFLDALSQPGTVTFNLFGHEIQLLPRVLTIDKKEHPWRSDTTIEIALPESPR